MFTIVSPRFNWAHKFSMGLPSLLCWKAFWNCPRKEMPSHRLPAIKHVFTRWQVSFALTPKHVYFSQKWLNLFKIWFKIQFLAITHWTLRTLQNRFLYSQCPFPMDRPTHWSQNCPIHFPKIHGPNLPTHFASCIDLYWWYLAFFRLTWWTSPAVNSILWYSPKSWNHVIGQEKHHCYR